VKLPGATQVVRPGIGYPYRLTTPWRWTLHTIECDPHYDPTGLARTHANPPHFWVCLPKQIIVQTIDTDRSGRALKGSSRVETNHARAVQVEIAGRAADTATYPAAWWEWLRDALLIPVAEHHGINLANQPPLWAESARAYGTSSQTRMSIAEWYAFDGLCGHQHVPDNSHWDPGPVPAHLLKPATAPAPPDPKELTVADIAAITARLDKIDASVAQLAAGTLQSAVNVATSVAEDTDELRLLLNGAGALVQHGGSKWFLYAGQRINVTHLAVPQQRELKRHFGIERHSAEVSDDVWAVLEAVTVERT